MNSAELSEQAKTWWVDDVEIFPDSLLGLRKPDGGFFLAVQEQSTNDGKIFFNLFQDEENIEHLGSVVYRSELPGLIGSTKSLLKTKAFKQGAIDQEAEHGLAFWHLDDERTLLVVFSTQLSSDLVDQAGAWFGETHVHFDQLIKGSGSIHRDDLMDVKAPPHPSLKRQKTV